MLLFNLPDLGEGLADAQIREWYVKEGDTVKAEQPLVAMETAKAVVDIPAPFTGTIAKLFGAPGDTILTHQPLVGFVGDESTTATKPSPSASHRDTGTVVGTLSSKETVLSAEIMTPATASSKTNMRATPAVRALAKRLGVDLNTLPTSGKSISLADVQQAAKATVTTKSTLTHPQPLSSIQRAMAQHMSEAHHRVVPATVSEEANIQAWATHEDYTVRCIRAIAHACQVEPLLNASFDFQHMSYQLNDAVNLAMAVDTAHGLFTPVIKNVNDLNNQQLRDEINRLKASAHAKQLRPEDLRDGTISLSNFGSIAGRYATLIIPIHLAAIIGIGAARETTHRILPISLTFDHRFITGGEATRFLRGLLDHLQQA